MEQIGDKGVSKKKVLKILQRGVKQQFFQIKGDKYKLTGKGRQLGGKSDENSSATKTIEKEIVKTEKSKTNPPSSENIPKNDKNEDKENVKSDTKKPDSK